MSTPNYLRVYVNGTLLSNRKVVEVRSEGDWVDEVYIDAPDFELVKKEKV